MVLLLVCIDPELIKTRFGAARRKVTALPYLLRGSVARRPLRWLRVGAPNTEAWCIARRLNPVVCAGRWRAGFRLQSAVFSSPTASNVKERARLNLRKEQTWVGHSRIRSLADLAAICLALAGDFWTEVIVTAIVVYASLLLFGLAVFLILSK
jgi:hypothetical protein